jgi:ABC-2 type transport system ATP-binding protein
MARRLAITRALVHSPQLVILDEPTLGVDPNERSVLWHHILQLRETGITVLLTTNVMEEASALCEQIAIMREGVLAAPVDTPEHLQQRFGGAVITVRAAAASDESMRGACDRLRQNRDIQRVEVTPGEQPGEFLLQVTAATEEPVTGQVITLLTGEGAVIGHVATRTPSLDEVFRDLTGGFRVRR